MIRERKTCLAHGAAAECGSTLTRKRIHIKAISSVAIQQQRRPRRRCNNLMAFVCIMLQCANAHARVCVWRREAIELIDNLLGDRARARLVIRLFLIDILMATNERQTMPAHFFAPDTIVPALIDWRTTTTTSTPSVRAHPILCPACAHASMACYQQKFVFLCVTQT